MSTPPNIRGERRGLTSVGWAMSAGILLAVLFLVGAWLIEPEPLKQRTRHHDIDITELVVPESLSEEELSDTSLRPDGSNVLLEEGAWVQVAGPDGSLAQQYSAQRIDPLPDGWMEMQRPRSMMYLDSGRVMTLRGEHGLLNVPNQAIESGTLDGDVVIRLFEPGNDGEIDITSDEPELIIRTEAASFDSSLGEIRCDESIRVDSREASFSGVGLTVLLGRDGETIERLMVERSTAPIRILRSTEREPRPGPATSPGPAGNTSSIDGTVIDEPGAEAPRFYQLTLEGNVEVRRFERVTSEEPTAILRGESLVSIFSLDGEGLSSLENRPSAGNDPAAPGDPTLGTLDLLGSSLIGAQDPPVADGTRDELIEIAYDGRLELVPLDPGREPGDVDDLVLVLESGRNPVEVIDVGNEAVATCERLSYRTDTGLIELLGEPGRPLEVSSPQMNLNGQSFWLDRDAGRGMIQGAGGLVFTDRGDGAEQLDVDWSGDVELRFRPGTDELESATFQRDVHVSNPGFDFRADELQVFLEAGADGRPRLERIVAGGDAEDRVRAVRVGEPGMLLADAVDLTLAPGPDGDPSPRRLLARGGVEASDDQQTVWTEELDVSFMPDRSDQGFKLDRVIAEDGVQVLLENGARAWAERLDGDGVNRRVTLSASGGDLVLLRGNVLADRLHSVTFDDRSQAARTEGPGRFRFFDEPFQLPASGPTDVPDRFRAPPSLEATWARLMVFDDLANRGGGQLDLEGDVMVRNVTGPLEENDLDAGYLRLDFSRLDRTPVIDASGSVSGPDVRAAFSNSRALSQLTARVDARMESRTWVEPDRRGDPDLFRIQGQDIVYVATSGDALIRGPGTLLVNRNPGSETTPDSGVGSGFGLGGDGTSRFSWTQGMTMIRQVSDRFDVTMNGDVEVLHAGLLPEDTMSMRADTLEILVDRPIADPASVPDGNTGPDDLDLGGQVDILRITARSGVFVRTTGQDVETDVFDYDVSNGIARLAGRGGRPVTLLSRQSPTPVRADRMTWDMKTGRIQITGAQGAAGR
ncbi:MAG: hypothetical protein VYB77_05190 [Planctomycetota bacterium]|nr:hypothetical protein [Planctomycetota bacterium]